MALGKRARTARPEEQHQDKAVTLASFERPLSHKDLASQLLALVETPKDSLMLTKAIKSVEAELKRRAKHSGSDLQKSSAQMHMQLALCSTLIPHAIMIEICKLLTQSKLSLMARTSKAMVDLAFGSYRSISEPQSTDGAGLYRSLALARAPICGP